MNLSTKYGVEVEEAKVFGFLLPYLELEMSEFLIILFYIDGTGWDGDVNGWQDKIIFNMFSSLESKQKSDVLHYIEENE